MLGKIYFDRDDMPGAERELRHARQLGYALDDVLPLLAQAFLRQAKFDELLALPVENFSGESLATLLSAQGLEKLAETKLEEAGLLIEQAVEEEPQWAYAQMTEARLIQASGDIVLLRAQLDTVFAIDPDYSPALSLLGDLELE